MGARRSRRRPCLHGGNPQSCAGCRRARWRLMLAYARVAQAAARLSPYCERPELVRLIGRLRSRIDALNFARGGFRAAVNRGQFERWGAAPESGDGAPEPRGGGAP